MAATSTHLRRFFRAHGYPTTRSVERRINAVIRPPWHDPADGEEHEWTTRPAGWLDDELRHARNKLDLPSLLTLRAIARALEVNVLEVIAEAAKDARQPLAPDVGIEGQLVAELMERVPRSQQMRLYGVVERIVTLMTEPVEEEPVEDEPGEG